MNDGILIKSIINNEIAVDTIYNKLAICDFRKKIYRILHKDISSHHANLVRLLMNIEISQRGKKTYDDDIIIDETYDFEAFYWCIFLLSQIGDVHDIFTIWKAKYMDFDSSLGVEWQFLIGAGFNETINFLKESNDNISLKILDYLSTESIQDIDNIEKWHDFRYNYFLNLS